MVQTFVETSLELHKMLVVILSMLIVAYLFLRICNYLYDLISRHTKSFVLKLVVMLFAITNILALILTLIIVVQKWMVM